MLHDIRDLAIFEKLTTVSRASGVYELLWYLDLEITSSKTVINALFRNVMTGELIVDAIAPEYTGYCSVGSFFKDGKKLDFKPPTGFIRDIVIDVPATVTYHDIGSVISDAEYDLNFVHKTKHGLTNYSHICKKTKCMVFWNGSYKIVIPCLVIASTYYLLSTSMRIQLFAQNLPGLYEACQYDPTTDTAYIILHRNARTEVAKHIARFAISPHSKYCWDNVMNGIRSSTYKSRGGTEYSSLVASIPVAQDNLAMQVRCYDVPNLDGGRTILVHEVLKEGSELPFKTLYSCRRENAPTTSDPLAKTELDADSNDKLTNIPPSKAYKGHQARQFNVPDNPVWEDIEFIQITLPPRYESTEMTTITEKTDDMVTLSPQKAKGDDPDNKVAPTSLDQEPPKKCPTPRMALMEFRELIVGFEAMEGVTDLFVSSDLPMPLKKNDSRSRLTMRESYDGDVWNRRRYIYATFRCEGISICLIEIDQSGLSTHVGTFVLSAAITLGIEEAKQAADDFVHDVNIGKMKTDWALRSIYFITKSHPPNSAKEHWRSWREKVLEMVTQGI